MRPEAYQSSQFAAFFRFCQSRFFLEKTLDSLGFVNTLHGVRFKWIRIAHTDSAHEAQSLQLQVNVCDMLSRMDVRFVMFAGRSDWSQSWIKL